MALCNLYKSRWTIDKCVLLLLLCERRLWDKGDKSLVSHVSSIMERMSGFYRIMLHAQAKQDMNIVGCPSKVSRYLKASAITANSCLLILTSAIFGSC